jgi:hypothetical protein
MGKIKILEQKYIYYFSSATLCFCIHPFPLFSPPRFLLIGRRGYMMMGHVKYRVVFFSARGVFILQVSNRNNSLPKCTQVNNRIIMQVQLGKGSKMCMQFLMFIFF